MCPIIFHVGPYLIDATLFCRFLTLAASIWVFFRLDRTARLNLGRRRILLLHLYLYPIGEGGALFFHAFKSLFRPVTSFYVTFQENHSSVGAALALVAGVLWLAHRWNLPRLLLLDLFCIASSLGFVFIRMGCLLKGCCKGAAATIPFLTIAYPHYVPGESPTLVELLLGKRWDEYANLFQGIPLHFHAYPIYYALGTLAIFLVLLSMRSQIRLRPGYVTAVWCLTQGALRILTEFLRTENPPYLVWRFNLCALVAAAFVLAGAIACVQIRITRRRGVADLGSPGPAPSEPSVDAAVGLSNLNTANTGMKSHENWTG